MVTRWRLGSSGDHGDHGDRGAPTSNRLQLESSARNPPSNPIGHKPRSKKVRADEEIPIIAISDAPKKGRSMKIESSSSDAFSHVGSVLAGNSLIGCHPSVDATFCRPDGTLHRSPSFHL